MLDSQALAVEKEQHMTTYLQAIGATFVICALLGLIVLSAKLFAYATIRAGGPILGLPSWWLKETYDKPEDKSYDEWERHIMLTMRVPAAAAGALLFVLTTALAIVVIVP